MECSLRGIKNWGIFHRNVFHLVWGLVESKTVGPLVKHPPFATIPSSYYKQTGCCLSAAFIWNWRVLWNQLASESGETIRFWGQIWCLSTDFLSCACAWLILAVCALLQRAVFFIFLALPLCQIFFTLLVFYNLHRVPIVRLNNSGV